MFPLHLYNHRFLGFQDNRYRGRSSAQRAPGGLSVWGLLLVAWIGGALLAAECGARASAGIDDRVSVEGTGPERSESADQILLVNARPLGARCDVSLMASRLQCERFGACGPGRTCWQSTQLAKVLANLRAHPMPTVIYIHGNRIGRGEDRVRGLMVYRSLLRRTSQGEARFAPIRYVVWSWPSTRILGPLHDYRVKAVRTRTAGWHLAWLVDQLPPETPLSMIGYSYGARVASGALHLLGGGDLSGLKLAQRAHLERRAVRVAYIAAAFDATWIHPGGYHGKSLSQMDRLALVNNRSDPAMRLFHLSAKRNRPLALGLHGFSQNGAVGEDTARIRSYDVSSQVGRTHLLGGYLSSCRSFKQIWSDVCYTRSGKRGQVPFVRSTGTDRKLVGAVPTKGT